MVLPYLKRFAICPQNNCDFSIEFNGDYLDVSTYDQVLKGEDSGNSL